MYKGNVNNEFNNEFNNNLPNNNLISGQQFQAYVEVTPLFNSSYKIIDDEIHYYPSLYFNLVTNELFFKNLDKQKDLENLNDMNSGLNIVISIHPLLEEYFNKNHLKHLIIKIETKLRHTKKDDITILLNLNDIDNIRDFGLNIRSIFGSFEGNETYQNIPTLRLRRRRMQLPLAVYNSNEERLPNTPKTPIAPNAPKTPKTPNTPNTPKKNSKSRKPQTRKRKRSLTNASHINGANSNGNTRQITRRRRTRRRTTNNERRKSLKNESNEAENEIEQERLRLIEEEEERLRLQREEEERLRLLREEEEYQREVEEILEGFSQFATPPANGGLGNNGSNAFDVNDANNSQAGNNLNGSSSSSSSNNLNGSSSSNVSNNSNGSSSSNNSNGSSSSNNSNGSSSSIVSNASYASYGSYGSYHSNNYNPLTGTRKRKIKRTKRR